MERADIYAGIKRALVRREGFAMGKLGYVEQCLISLPVILSGNVTEIQKKAFCQLVKCHAKFQTGIYPVDQDFLNQYATHLGDACKLLDAIGWFESTYENIIRDVLPGFDEKKTGFRNTEPPLETDSDCCLQLFKGRNLLIINQVSGLMAGRLRKDIYEKVWDCTKKKPFGPGKVAFLEFPYSYHPVEDARLGWGNELEMILEKIKNTDFGIAIIGAGARGISIATGIREMGKIGLSIGGHLQVITGIIERRRERDPYYAENILNEAWISIPDHLIPRNEMNLTDQGSYW